MLAVYVMRASRRVSLLRLGWEVLLRGADQVQELDLFRVAEAAVETRRRRLQVALDGEVAAVVAAQVSEPALGCTLDSPSVPATSGSWRPAN